MLKTIEFDRNYTMVINGEEISSATTFQVINPANEEVIAEVPSATKEILDTAVDGAKKAFKEWSKKSADERGEYLVKFADELEKHKENLMTLLTKEQGKPRHSGSAGELNMSIQWLRELSLQRLESKIIEDNETHTVEQRFTPLGVVGAITPWNFPILLAIWQFGPALMAGNTVVLKPSPYTPLCTLKLGEIARDIFPPGVLNIVSGGNDLGQWITEHPDISKITFTGSTPTGKKVMQSAASNLKRVTLELGGNNAAIVLPDVDPKSIVKELFWTTFDNSSQWCNAVKRLYVHDDIYDEFLSEYVQYAKTVKVGPGTDPDTVLGPVQNKMQYEKLKDLIRDTKNSGANIVLGGNIEETENTPGYYIPITIVDNPEENSRVVVEEPFGPILPLLRYSDYDEVIARANNSIYGLGASVWGKNVELATSIALQLEGGSIYVNEIQGHGSNIPFGGHKQSGIGVENSIDGLAEFTNSQSVFISKKTPK